VGILGIGPFEKYANITQTQSNKLISNHKLDHVQLLRNGRFVMQKNLFLKGGRTSNFLEIKFHFRMCHPNTYTSKFSSDLRPTLE
jgi:hypothetical protein